MGKRRSLVRQVLDRFDSLMATGESRHAAKLAARAANERTWSVSDGRLHAFRTRKGYQAIVLRLVNWCATTQGLRFRDLNDVDACAEEVVSRYLAEGLDAGKSAWTLKTERSAFRLFFGQRELAAGVQLPARRRADIKRSRHPAARDATFDATHWRELLTFLDATGLRRSEVAHLHVRDLYDDAQGGLHVAVKGKGGKWRAVPVLPDSMEAVRVLIAGRSPDERLFRRIPSHLDIHAARRRFAQATYRQLSDGRPLPPSTSARLAKDAIDPVAARQVSEALGHNRMDVTTTHYLR
ncbi:MAG TPA: tyrosine-type recombinase/integrase [Ktedonobacterales bacterium]